MADYLGPLAAADHRRLFTHVQAACRRFLGTCWHAESVTPKQQRAVYQVAEGELQQADGSYDTASTTIQVQAEPPNLIAPVHPFTGKDDTTRRAIDDAVLGVEDMIHRAIRQSFPRINRADHDDLVQRVRIHLAMYSLPRFDAARGVKVSTFLCTCIANQVNSPIKKPWPLLKGKKKPSPTDDPDELTFVPYKPMAWSGLKPFQPAT